MRSWLGSAPLVYPPGPPPTISPTPTIVLGRYTSSPSAAAAALPAAATTATATTHPIRLLAHMPRSKLRRRRREARWGPLVIATDANLNGATNGLAPCDPRVDEVRPFVCGRRRSFALRRRGGAAGAG